MNQIELVGVAEIASLAGVTKQAVSNWQARHDNFPRPIQRLQTGPVWDKEAIARWLKNYKGEPTHVVSFINLKGGVGKTTLCTAVAEILAHEKKKHVLVIDLDPQTNATVSLISGEKWEEMDLRGQTLAQLFLDQLDINRKPVFSIDEAIVHGVSSIGGGISRLDLLPSSIRLIDIQDQIPMIAVSSSFAINPLDILKNAVSGILDRYDFVLIDCPPSLGTITKNGLRISTGYVIPTIPDIVSTWGVHLIVDAVRRFGSQPVQPLGIVASKKRGNALHGRIFNDMKHGRLGRFGKVDSDLTQPPLFSDPVPDTVDVARGADVEAGLNTLNQKYGADALHAFRSVAAELEARCLQMIN